MTAVATTINPLVTKLFHDLPSKTCP